MKRLSDSEIALLLPVCVLALVLTAGSAKADFAFGEPVNLKSVIPVLDPAHESVDCFSSDGLEIYVESDRSGGQGNYDLWVLRRGSIHEDWAPPENLGPSVNSPNVDVLACISADGLTLYFQSNRSGGSGSTDIYMTTRPTRDAPWGPTVNLGPKVNSSTADGSPWITPDGLELYFSSSRSGGRGNVDIYVARRTTANGLWGDPVNLGPVVNSAYDEGGVSLSPDGLLLLFTDSFGTGRPPRPGGYGSCDMWMTRRASVSEPWQAPVNLGPQVNRPMHEILPRISADGSMLYFATNSSGIWDNWQAPILPIVDFNADGKVDLVDLVMLIDDWGKTKSVCDIGPMPWGDGKVDIEDLKVFMTYYEKENPPAQP